MNKTTRILLLPFFFVIGLHATVTEDFEKIMNLLPIKDNLASTIEGNINKFSLIQEKFENGIFSKKQKIINKNQKLRETVSYIAERVEVLEDLTPSHLRWLRTDISNLAESSLSVIYQILTKEERNMIISLCHFTKDFEQLIAPASAPLIGTRWSRFVDSYLYRPAEFYKRNWKWTVPLTLLGGKVSYDFYKYAGSPREIGNLPAVEDINEERGFLSRTADKYKNYLILPIAGLFSSFSKKDGFLINAETGKATNQPLQSVFLRGNRQITIPPTTPQGQPQQRNETFVRKLDRFDATRQNNSDQYVVRSLQGLNQKVAGPCPFYALFHTYCLYRNHEEGVSLNRLLDRNLFTPLFRRWKNIVKKRRISRLAKTITSTRFRGEHPFYFAHEQWVNQNTDFIENNSVYQIFDAWVQHFSTNQQYIRYIRKAINEVCFNAMRDNIKRTIKKNKTKWKFLKIHRNHCTESNLTGKFDNHFKSWQKLKLDNKELTSFYKDKPKVFETFPKRRRFFVRRELDLMGKSLPGDDEITILIKTDPELQRCFTDNFPNNRRELKNCIKVIGSNQGHLFIQQAVHMFHKTGAYWNNRRGEPIFMIVYTGNGPSHLTRNNRNKFTDEITFSYNDNPIWGESTKGKTETEIRKILYKKAKLENACDHVIAAKIEWSDPINKRTPIITIIDSFAGQDSRFSKISHWIHDLFLH